jgi:hypothetical protein
MHDMSHLRPIASEIKDKIKKNQKQARRNSIIKLLGTFVIAFIISMCGFTCYDYYKPHIKKYMVTQITQARYLCTALKWCLTEDGLNN